MGMRIARIFIPAAVIAALCACTAKPAYIPNPDLADSLISSAYQSLDYGRIISLSDSLEVTGDLSKVKACFWRGYAYSRQRNRIKAEENWSNAINLEVTDDIDLDYYVRSANRLAELLLLKGEYESALRVSLPAIEKVREAGIEGNGDYANLLASIGCCEMHQGNFDEADAHFRQAYLLFIQLIQGDSGRPLQNMKSAIAGLITITSQSLENGRYPDALTWVVRLEALLEEYKGMSDVKPDNIDRQRARVELYRACALEGMGQHEEAGEAYERALSTNYAKTGEGRMESARYLMLAHRWKEAADIYQLFDTMAASFGISITLDNISHYLVPKYLANYNARRYDEAMRTGLQICDKLDSALIWNREDKAAELATLFHTQEMKRELIEQKADNERERYFFSVAALSLIIIAALLFILFRYRASQRLKEAYRQLETANAHAQEASKVKTVFLQQISHEIRTPLNLLSGFSQVLTTPGMELDEQTREQIKTGVISNTGRITGLINKMLELSDLVSKPELARNDHIPALQIAAEAADRCGIHSTSGINFEIHAAKSGENPILATDRQAATRILALLLENAVKFTGEGSVDLRLATKKNYVSFIVEDTGIGVPPEEAEHIFEHFVQLDDNQEGTGIGLSLARSLSRRLGGDVVVDTAYTSGARFIFSLPRNGGISV